MVKHAAKVNKSRRRQTSVLAKSYVVARLIEGVGNKQSKGSRSVLLTKKQQAGMSEAEANQSINEEAVTGIKQLGRSTLAIKYAVS